MVLSASSANMSGEPSVADAAAVKLEPASGVAGIFDFGPAPSGGLPSTVLDVIDGPRGPEVRILRPGVIDAAQIAQAGFAVTEFPAGGKKE